jgi:hypothetical protein
MRKVVHNVQIYHYAKIVFFLDFEKAANLDLQDWSSF